MQTPKIKILFRHRSMEMGGVEKVLLSLLNNLDRNRFEMTVLLNLDQGELRHEIPAHVRKIAIAKGKEDMSKNPLIQKIQLLWRRWKLNHYQNNLPKEDAKLLQNETFDIEVAMDWRDFQPVLNSPNKKSKKVGWFHSEIQVPKFQPLVPMVLESFPKFDHMVYCSQRTKDLMHQYYPSLAYPPESIIINAIPIEEIKNKSNEEITDFPQTNVPVFLGIGRLHTRKGYHKLMEAHSKLIKDGFLHKIVILGDGEELKNLLEQQKQLGVEDSFILLGNRMNPYPYLKKANYFIMPSESEAWPLVLAEALILQKPSIATDSGDVATMVQNGKTGVLIRYEIDEIYSSMKEFLTNENLISEMKNNLLSIEKHFDNTAIFNTIENLFTSLTNNEKPNI